MTDDPISELIRDWPTPAVVRTSKNRNADYDPRVTASDQGVEETPLVGHFTNQVEAGASYAARFTIRASDRPSHLKGALSRCIVGGVDYGVMGVQTRRWEGKINGYTLELGE